MLCQERPRRWRQPFTCEQEEQTKKQGVCKQHGMGREIGRLVTALPLSYYATEQDFLCGMAARWELSNLATAERTLPME